MNLIWSCTPGPLVKGSFGGYSDRLKGIVTGYLLARYLERRFFIEWTGQTRLADYFDSRNYLSEPSSAESAFFGLVDKLETESDIARAISALESATAENLYVSANQYDHLHWKLLGASRGTMQSAFADILSGLLRPGKAIFDHQAYRNLQLRMANRNVLGVAIRIGDQSWDRPGSIRVPKQQAILAAVGDHPSDAVLLVSDSPQWKRDTAKQITRRDVIMLEYETANIDRSDPKDAVRTFPIFLIEHYLLQQCAAIITGDGGGGRTAAWLGRKPLVELIK